MSEECAEFRLFSEKVRRDMRNAGNVSINRAPGSVRTYPAFCTSFIKTNNCQDCGVTSRERWSRVIGKYIMGKL